MAFTSSLCVSIVFTTFLLCADAIVSLALVSSMVAFLHHGGAGPFLVGPPHRSPFLLFGEPANLVTNQGHTTNAAGGTVVILLGFGGIIALWFELRSRNKRDKPSPIFYTWAVFVLLSFLLTMTALIYTFVETSKTSGQVIDLAVAEANLPPAPYPNDRWTPENWYSAVLDLPLMSEDQRLVISYNLGLMRAWRWNLVPLFLLGFALLVLVALKVWRVSRNGYQTMSVPEAFAGPSK